MSEPVKDESISGWGRYPVQQCRVYRPEKRRAIREILLERGYPHIIARGLGRSYGDPSTNGGGSVLKCERINRMLEFDEATGVLRCEAGVSLAEIIDVFLPRGFFLPTSPGTKFVTVGGSIAHDVHGKNHHSDGTFGEAVIDFELLIPNGEVLLCSREENGDVFWATLGGCGLTGIILTARIRLRPVETAYYKVDYLKLPNLDALLNALDEGDRTHRFSVSWVDCLAKGKSLGRSVAMLGNDAQRSDLPPSFDEPYDIGRKPQRWIPFDFPEIALNTFTMSIFNGLYYSKSGDFEGHIEDYESYWYPLDAFHHWNRLYGKRGFVQYQVTFPSEEREGLVELLELVSSSGRGSFLAVLKKFGPANEGMLSFPFAGFTLTLDFPVREGLTRFLYDLDEKTLKHGGRLYLAKDAVMRPETFRAMYPRVDEFMEVRRRLDPESMLSSSLARRLGLAEEIL